MGQPRPGASPTPVYSTRDYFTKNPRAIRIAILSLILTAIALFALFAIPVSHSYSFEMAGPERYGGTAIFTNYTFPSGADVTGSWSTACTNTSEFGIANGQQYVEGRWVTNWMFWNNSASGQFAFHSLGGAYMFEFYCDGSNYTVSISGTYSVPLL